MTMVRLAKVVLTGAIAILCLLIGYNNIVDYGSNLMFVQHVLSMDTTFPDNAVRINRAVSDPRLQSDAYLIIIVAELAIGLACLAGTLRMMLALNAPAATFNKAKKFAVLGLSAGVAFWLMAFLVVGGEWFQMWQSQMWNGQEAAFRFVTTIGLVLIFVSLKDTDED
jgi:predicted small integral membrane protein